MCEEYGVIIGEQTKPCGSAIECDRKPLGGTVNDCPNYRFLLVGSGRHWMSFSSSPSVPIGGSGIRDIGTSSVGTGGTDTGGDNPGFGAGQSGGKDTGGNNRAFSAGYLSRLRKGLSSWKSGESSGKGTGDGQDTGGSSNATASGKKTT